MENLEWILSLAGAVFVFLSTAVGLLFKLVKASKAKNAAEIKNVLADAAREAVAFAETVKGATGATKKSVALTQISQAMLSRGLECDNQAASDAVEELITLSKEVNVRGDAAPEAPQAMTVQPYGTPQWP